MLNQNYTANGSVLGCVTSAISKTEFSSAIHKIVPELLLRHELRFFVFASTPTIDIEPEKIPKTSGFQDSLVEISGIEPLTS